MRQVEVAADWREAEGLLNARMCEVFRVDVVNVSNLRDVVRAIGEGVGFPNYFGQNLNALEECLRDLVGSNWCLVLTNADSLMQIPQEDLRVLLSIFIDVSDFWKSEGAHFSTILIGGKDLRGFLSATR